MLPLTPQSQIVCKLAWKELNLRPTAYKAVALTTELHASSRAGRIRTHTHLVKSQGCCRYTPTRKLVGRIRLHRRTVDILILLVVREILKVVALGIELSATRLSAVFGQPALDYH